MSFSQRVGIKPVREAIQVAGMDDALRNAIWDCIHLCVWEKFQNVVDNSSVNNSNLKWFVFTLWHRYFNLPIDSAPKRISQVIQFVRDYFYGCAWNECYDLLEFAAESLDETISRDLVKLSNGVLARHLSGFRFIEKQITPITSEQEIESIEAAVENPLLNSGARAHFRSALEKLSDRDSPDHRNSIKESISAVESAYQQLTGDSSATLGQALKPLEGAGLIHPALKGALSQLYGYTSDADGIRHAMLDEPTVSFADSKFMLVSCTAFVNYLILKSNLRTG